MVGEPLLRMGEDFMGVRLPVEMNPPRVGGSGLAGRGCASEITNAEIWNINQNNFNTNTLKPNKRIQLIKEVEKSLHPQESNNCLHGRAACRKNRESSTIFVYTKPN